MAEFDPDAYLAGQPFDPDAYLGQPPKKYQFLRPKGVATSSDAGGGPVGATLRADPDMGPLEAGLRVAASGATFGLDAPVRGALLAATKGIPYQEARRETDLADQQAHEMAGAHALPLALGGGAVSALAMPGLSRVAAPITSQVAPTRGVLGLLKSVLTGTTEAATVSGLLGLARGAGTDKGAEQGLKEGFENPWNLAGGLGGAASWAGARARPAAQEAAAHYLQVDPVEAQATMGGQNVPMEAAFRRSGQRAIDLGAVEPGPTMGERAVGLNTGIQAMRDEAVQIAQQADAMGAAIDRTALLRDIQSVILDWLDKPGTREANRVARAEADKVLNTIVNDNDLRTGAPISNLIRFKEKLQGDHFTGQLEKGAMRDTLEKALRDAARVARQHTEFVIDAVDPKLGARFKALNKAQHENIPLAQAAEGAAARRLSTSRQPGDVTEASSPRSYVGRVVSGNLLRDTAPWRIKGNLAADRAYQATPPGVNQYLLQLLRHASDREAEIPYRYTEE